MSLALHTVAHDMKKEMQPAALSIGGNILLDCVSFHYPNKYRKGFYIN
jgi:hypothetical protein